MQCPRCQHQNPQQAKFCLECGARLALTCAKCRAELPGSAKFCLECGEPVGPQIQTRSLESYTPKHLAEKIINSKAALEGERKQVSVLFADLKGSMELLADRDPEEARKILDPVLAHMMDAVHRYEGTVNQVMGDGIMALFGAPLAHEDHAVRACYAALRMQESVKKCAEDVWRSVGVLIQIRVGLNSGEVVVRSVGSDLHMDYTAVGQTTHLAARMEQMATPGTTLIAADTLRLAEGFVQVRPLGPTPVKGLNLPIEVYELTGVSAVRSRLQAAAVRGLSRFVGRDAEMEQLRSALEHVRQGRGQVAAIVGEPGVGKSRLVFELTHSHRVEGWLVLEASSVSYGKATSYLPVIDLLKGYFRIADRDTHRDIREKVTGKLLTLDEALKPARPALLALLDVPVDDPQWQALDPPQRRQRTLDAVKRLLIREAQVQPLLVVFEDLHWIDTETQTLLDSLVEVLPTARLLLLVNYRPEYHHAWGGKTYYRQLRVDPLPAESVDDLLGSLLGAHASLTPLKRTLIERTEGNPLFLEESVRTLVETNALVGERGAYRLAQDPRTIQVPATVQAILAARIDRLPPEDKNLLQTAAVIGEEVPFAVLLATDEYLEETLFSGLSRLQAAELLYEARLFPDLVYTFKHGLTRQVAYETLLEARRAELHAKVVEVLERLYHDRASEHVELLANHALRGKAWDKAVRYLHQAGNKAAGRSAYLQAVAYFEQAIGVSQQLPETIAVREQAVDIRLDLRNAFLALGEYRRIVNCLREAEHLAEALGDEKKLGRVYSLMTAALVRSGDLERSLETGERALALAAHCDDASLKIATTLFLGLAHVTMGAYPAAVDLLGWNVEYLTGDLSRERFGLAALPSVQSRAYVTECLAELGRFGEGIRCGEEAIRIGEAVDHPFSIAIACQFLGSLYVIKGDVSSAVLLLERALALSRTNEIRQMFPSINSRLGLAYVLSGRADEGLILLEGAVEQAMSAAMGARQQSHAARLSQGNVLTGRIRDAAECANGALDLARRYKERGTEGYLLSILGEIAFCQDPPDVNTAGRYFREAMVLADKLGMRPLVAHCHLGLGKLYRRTGEREQAQGYLRTATTMYREMDMTYWLERAEAEQREAALLQ